MKEENEDKQKEIHSYVVYALALAFIIKCGFGVTSAEIISIILSTIIMYALYSNRK